MVPVLLPKRTTDDDGTTAIRKKYPASHATARVGPPAQRVGGGHGGAPGARRGSCRVRAMCHAERRRGKFKRKRRSGVMVCVGICDAPRGTGSFLSGSMVVLSTPRPFRGPTRADSIRNPNNQLANRTFDDRGGKVPAGGVLVVNGANRHPRPRRLHRRSLRVTQMAERDRW